MGKRRPSGDGMVRKRDDGRWEGRIVVGHKANGDPIFRHVYAKTQKALTEKLHQSIECYQDVELTEDSRMTLGEWLDRWLAEYKDGTIRPGTLEGYRNYIENYIKPQLGGKHVSLITTQDVQRMYRRLKTLLEEAGLPSIRFHDLRHTFATHALTSGVDAKTLAGILGHTNASFTLDTYTHVTPDMREAAGGIVGGFMENLFGKELKPWQRNEKQATD